MLLHYYPRNALLRGCSAVTEQQGGHSICMYEAASVLAWQDAEADRVPIRCVVFNRPAHPTSCCTEFCQSCSAERTADQFVASWVVRYKCNSQIIHST
jgi:hypothetical protein